ncbi:MULTISPECIES: DUF7284 family protein [Salinibaculum]|uniref:DUF7284 family protein n=1 Tax=Salinibaculum TaxID=2732368 RepID=UPI0030D60EB4
MRAISTVLDVAVFLLLVSAAVGTVVYAPTPVASGPAVEQTAEVLATTTATVEYDLRQEQRRAHGTLATLLAKAALANTTVSDVPVTTVSGTFGSAVRRRVRATVRAPNRTQVTAVWRPYRGAPVEGRVAVGSPPPSAVDVSVATLQVPSPVVSTAARSAGPAGGYRDLAGRVARRVTETLLPSTSHGAALGQSGPRAAAAASRYRSMADALGLDATPFSRGDVAGAHSSIAGALTRRLATDMRTRFESPAGARDALRTGTVTIAVRRWEP